MPVIIPSLNAYKQGYPAAPFPAAPIHLCIRSSRRNVWCIFDNTTLGAATRYLRLRLE
jgi:hypothetical protein